MRKYLFVGMKDDKKRNHMRQKVTEYMDRAEKIKKLVQDEKEAGKYHEQIQIADNSIGNDYEKIFGRFLDENLLSVEIDDPYVRTTHQIYNFLRFCELLIKKSKNLREITLMTGIDEQNHSSQEQKFEKICFSLKKYNVTLKVHYSGTLHDREIRFDNGWVIKVGRGLDYFKPTENNFSIGFCDLSLRPCHETTVDIFHKKSLKT
ncbi:MIT domain-containing protein 1-like [Centruroides sculpturatus]|uniref:MIT domain-containing protein 1-like n=1 Tax=Centruroides sculpturatus TaxID=218467 RepID=UPI000C6D1B65|nr:MIT domain-containing protein 1-like [Centruroides sculpturatus]XP_023215598.1 MIT domain-containing protein 1-like [Centruroides sculpturatus]